MYKDDEETLPEEIQRYWACVRAWAQYSDLIASIEEECKAQQGEHPAHERHVVVLQAFASLPPAFCFCSPCRLKWMCSTKGHRCDRTFMCRGMEVCKQILQKGEKEVKLRAWLQAWCKPTYPTSNSKTLEGLCVAFGGAQFHAIPP